MFIGVCWLFRLMGFALAAQNIPESPHHPLPYPLPEFHILGDIYLSSISIISMYPCLLLPALTPLPPSCTSSLLSSNSPLSPFLSSFLGSTVWGDHVVFVFLSLTYFAQFDDWGFSCKWQNFVLSYSWVLLHWVWLLHSFIGSSLGGLPGWLHASAIAHGATVSTVGGYPCGMLM